MKREEEALAHHTYVELDDSLKFFKPKHCSYSHVRISNNYYF
ncbi:hypothetical protein A359_02640 [secondary endosymbiont of Ctenarytaina eucalypti]|uniref:Uncharacterized protein n=1 Tax=secondary endosymbiont of Ctenarytaina eucalypti TaxID=1199245 RepID=J3TX44_9ENTR|nr:hypothetical protein A359_02640 [secondary endosymbiont of Ctenarytaina eucalypti]